MGPLVIAAVRSGTSSGFARTGVDPNGVSALIRADANARTAAQLQVAADEARCFRVFQVVPSWRRGPHG